MAERTVTEPGLPLGAQQLAALVDSTRELIAILASDGSVQFANSSFQTVLGYRPEELLGRSLQAIVHAMDTGTVRECLKQVISTPGGSFSERCRFRCRDGSWRWVQVTLRNRLGETGVEGILVHGSDVTDLQRMEDERQVISDVVHALNRDFKPGPVVEAHSSCAEKDFACGKLLRGAA